MNAKTPPERHRDGCQPVKLKQQLQQILEEGLRRKDAKERPASAYDAARGYVLRRVYRLALRYQQAQQLGRIEAIVQRRTGYVPVVPIDHNPFQWALAAVDPDAILFSRKHAVRLAKQLLYAARHKVPTRYLIGFLHQSGSSDDVVSKQERGEWEPWGRKLQRRQKPTHASRSDRPEKKRSEAERIRTKHPLAPDL